jgi:hypothetical protein
MAYHCNLLAITKIINSVIAKWVKFLRNAKIQNPSELP